jgi:hypothetical protein
MIAALVLVGLLSLDVCDACRVDGTAVKLCSPHASAEKTAIQWCGKGLRAKDEAERIAALEKLAAETETHVNAPSPRIVVVLRRAFDDDSFAVRTRAVELLGPPQHGPEALDALIDALEQYDDEFVRCFRAGVPDIGAPPKTKKQVDEFGETTAALAENSRRMDMLCAWGGVIVTQLGRFPDARAEKALLDSMGAMFAVNPQRGLLALGTAGAVRRAGAALVLAHVECNRAGSGEEARRKLREIQDDLAAFAAARELPAPAWEPSPVDGWKAWLAAHEAALPTSLPGVRSPAW